MKAYGRMEVQLLLFLTWAVDRGEQSASHPNCITVGERAHCTYWTGGWVAPKAGMEPLKKREISCPFQESDYRSSVIQPIVQSLYSLSYFGFCFLLGSVSNLMLAYYVYSAHRNKLHTFLISLLHLKVKHTRESRCETAEVPKYLYFSLCISFRPAGLYRSHYSDLLVKKIMICI